MSLFPWYHGGPPGRKPGDKLLPPSKTGADQLSNYAPKELSSAHARDDRVFLTPQAEVAAMFAVVHQGGVVYRVDPDGPLEPDPDYLGPKGSSWQVTSVTVLTVVEVPESVRRAWLAAMAGGNDR